MNYMEEYRRWLEKATADEDVVAELKAMDEETPDLGIRAFVWNVEKSY